MYPFTLLLFLAALPKLRKLEFPKLHKAIMAYFAYIFIQGLILSPLTGALKYFIVIFFKQLQYFMVFYMLLYTFQSPGLKDKMMKFIAVLAGANLLWALMQIVTEHQVSYRLSYDSARVGYAIGAIGENQPHQAAAIFLFCFLFSYLHKGLKFRKAFMLLSVLAVIATISRITIIAIGICIIFILISDQRCRKLLQKPLVATTLLLSVFLLGFFHRTTSNSFDILSYNMLTSRMGNIREEISIRTSKWQKFLEKDSYSSHRHINKITGMGRGYGNTWANQWKLGVDCGYFRDILEIGIIGLLLHLLIFFRAGLYIDVRKFWILFLPFLILSITYEVFLMSKSGIVILLLAALLIKKPDLIYDRQLRISGISK